MTMAATMDQHRRPRNARLGDRDRCLDAPAGVGHLLVEAAQVGQVLEGQRVPCRLDGVGRRDRVEHGLSRRSRYLMGHSARHQFGQEGVQPTGAAVAGPAQVDVALGQQAQHAGMVVTLDAGQAGGTQGGDGHRTGVVGVDLVGPPRTQEPDPGGQRGGHVENTSIGRHAPADDGRSTSGSLA
jgi:hypothetical protein